MIVNAAHVRTHGMTMKEYKEYEEPKTAFQENKFSNYPVYQNMNAEDKGKIEFLKQFVKQLIPSQHIQCYYGLVDPKNTMEDFACGYCGLIINGMHVYFILKSRDELVRNQVMEDQKGLHDICAFYTAQRYHRVSFSFNMDVLKVSIH